MATRSKKLGTTVFRLDGGSRWPLHYLALFFISIGIGLTFLRPPGFGDDLTYWSLAFGLHHDGPGAWTAHSHHALRWPVWGVSWLWQGIFGPGLASFYCTPLIYLIAGAALAFSFGRRLSNSLGAAWACAISFLFLPLIDPVLTRPMPDLSESVFGAIAVFSWWKMMEAKAFRSVVQFGALAGLSIGLSYSNRITGVFIAPVLAISTLLLFRKSWKRLLVPAGIAALFVLIEGSVYHSICGDWLQSIHGNLGAGGATDTHVMQVWQLPVRYLGDFFRANRLAPIYAALALGGGWIAWSRQGTGGRIVVIWFVVLTWNIAARSKASIPSVR